MGSGTKKLYNQFNVQSTVDYPCDSNFYALLNQEAILKRPWDSDEGVKAVNDYGEVIMTYPTAQVINTSLKIRIDPAKTRNKDGFKVETQGGIVTADYTGFVCPGTDVRENDVLCIGTQKYQVLLVDPLFGASNLHHLELRLTRIDLL